jgi:hypothetical protein
LPTGGCRRNSLAMLTPRVYFDILLAMLVFIAPMAWMLFGK